MTTLAFDGRYAAADGRATCGNMITGKQAKKLFLINGVLNGEETEYLFMGAGSFAMLTVVQNWLEQGNDLFSQDPDLTIPELQPESFEGMIVTRNKEVFDLEDTLVPMPAESPSAGGSGCPFALTAMNCGQNAVQAVYTAIGMDIGSGGQVTAFDTEAWEFVLPGDVR
jgi:hypothetical protein